MEWDAYHEVGKFDVKTSRLFNCPIGVKRQMPYWLMRFFRCYPPFTGHYFVKGPEARRELVTQQRAISSFFGNLFRWSQKFFG